MTLIKNPPFRMRLWIYAFGHFFFECMASYFVVAMIGPHITSYREMLYVLIVYNVCDYGLQLLIGLLDDVLHRNHYFAAFGAVLFVLSYFCAAHPLLMAGVVGVGAAFIHVPLGRQVILDRPHVYAPLAPFVASGSFGVFLGRQAAFSHVNILLLLIVVACAVAIVLIVLGAGEPAWNLAAEAENSACPLRFTRTMLMSVLLLVAAVAVQSFTYAIMVFRWDVGVWAWGSAIAILVGKACGGWCVDRFGYERSIIVSSVVALICAIPAVTYPAVGMIFVCAINIPAATVIFRLARTFGAAAGSGFGLYKLFHLIGFFPTLFWGTGLYVSPLVLIILTVIIAGLMLLEAYSARLGNKAQLSMPEDPIAANSCVNS